MSKFLRLKGKSPFLFMDDMPTGTPIRIVHRAKTGPDVKKGSSVINDTLKAEFPELWKDTKVDPDQSKKNSKS